MALVFISMEKINCCVAIKTRFIFKQLFISSENYDNSQQNSEIGWMDLSPVRHQYFFLFV